MSRVQAGPPYLGSMGLPKAGVPSGGWGEQWERRRWGCLGSVQASQNQHRQFLPFGPQVPGATREEARETVATLSPPVFLWSIQVVQPTRGE